MKLPTIFRSDSGVSDMSRSSKSKKSKSRIHLSPNVGHVFEELQAPISSEIVFRKTWKIYNFHNTISSRETVDSPKFQCSINGTITDWNMAIRFWKGPDGKKISNPIVVCLSLVGCETEMIGQARIKFQFGIWNAQIKNWERCNISTVVMDLQNMNEIHSIGYETFKISDRHLNSAEDLSIMVKIQVIHSEEEKHSLSQDLAKFFNLESRDLTDTIVECTDMGNIKTFKVHSFIIKVRSPLLGLSLVKHNDAVNENINYKLNLRHLDYGVAQELFRYIYSDKVDNMEHVNNLLPLSTKFNLTGLTTLCERALLESLTPNNVANILILANQYDCEKLRRAALHYCKESEEIRNSIDIELPTWTIECENCALSDKILEQLSTDATLESIKQKDKTSFDRRNTLRYHRQNENTQVCKLMKMTNPDLFQEACESLANSSSNADSSSILSSSSSDFL